ncbi:Gfo/Idh/MocA family oxidoreductase [Mucilaginibacter sp. UR6-1]|uniref:Gfo/Idh/MocA family oxidoreductase n=1 Tax=Mucilaginibacter sp. UR6-1 TaxID=1435643 RepID=UPI001E5DAE00|nr:Gfo/Idh/MocA family oxidoreductase [Mucilaginibacter sp. UR6-1]MCC8408812.1 Gfo/Idh/MocA family oxidoreductase [Mucilaginibacter sp. UR6-1]
MSSPIVAGLMAFGMSGRVFHAPFLNTSENFRLKAVVERNQKKAQEYYPDIISYNAIDELLNDREIELVVINTPNYTHYDLAKRALNAGKHVLLEKPAAATTAEVKEMFDLAHSKGLNLLVYQNRRWDSGFLSVKEVIESGRLGDLIEVHFRFDRYRAAIGPKTFKESKDMVANGISYDLGPHLLDNAIALFGRPLSWHKTTGSYRKGSQVDDYINLHLKYPNQVNVYLTAGLLIAEHLPAFVVHGTLGSFVKPRTDVQEDQLNAGMMPTDAAYGIEPDGSEGKLVTFDENGDKLTEMVPSKKGDYKNLFKAVYHTIRDGALFPVTEEHIAWQIEILEA